MEECKLGILDKGKCTDLGGVCQVKNLDYEVMKNMIFYVILVASEGSENDDGRNM